MLAFLLLQTLKLLPESTFTGTDAMFLLQFLDAAFDPTSVDASGIVRLFQVNYRSCCLHHRVLLVVFNQFAQRVETFTAANIVLLVLCSNELI